MDIVNLSGFSNKKSQKAHKSRERRHTTDARSNLKEGTNLHRENSLSEEHLSSEGSHLEDLSASYSASMSLSSSWNSLFDVGDFETPGDADYYYFEGSQATSFEPEVKCDDSKHQYQLSYELALDDGILTQFANNQALLKSSGLSPPRPSRRVSHIAHVIHELRSTEKVYVEDLSQVVAGYQVPLESRVGVLSISHSDLQDLFGNISEIIAFHESLLDSLQKSGDDPQEIALCFLSCADGFKIYTRYCNNYPQSVNILTSLSQDDDMSMFLKTCQKRLNHMLPLGAYLLKPVQRVLKYSLLLTEMLKCMSTTEPCYTTLSEAIQEMTAVAEHINSMKRKYDAAVHIQEIQSLIKGNMELDLSEYGELVQEENFRYSGSKSTGSTFRGKTERYVFLFQQLFLITKKEEDGFLYKTHLKMKDLQLTEKVEKDQNCFQIRHVHTGRSYTFQAQSLERKQLWVHMIKLQLMESIPELPTKAKEMILRGFTSKSEPVSPSMTSKEVEPITSSSNTVQPSPQPSTKSASRKKLKRQQVNRSALTFAHATLTGFLSSHIYQENDDPVSSDGENSEVLDSQASPTLSEETSPKQSFGAYEHSAKAGQSPLVPTNFPSSVVRPENHYSIDVANHGSAEEWKGSPSESSPSVEFEIVSTNFTSLQPDVEIEIDQTEKSRRFDDKEDLFIELMSSDGDAQATVDRSKHSSLLPAEIHDVPLDYRLDLTNETESGTGIKHVDRNPVMAYSSSVEKLNSNHSTDSENQITPKASPTVKRSGSDKFFQIDQPKRSHTLGTHRKSVEKRSFPCRRHSFENDTWSKPIGLFHMKQDSFSTDNTPLSSPNLRTKYNTTDISPSVSLIAKSYKPNTFEEELFMALELSKNPEIGLTAFDSKPQISDEDVNEQFSPIIPPPEEFAQNPMDDSLLVSHSEYTEPTESPNLFSPSPGNVEDNLSISSNFPPSYQSNPDEVITIDEVLASFNEYADTTGKQSRGSSLFQSPQPKRKGKKKRSRNLTIASIDSGTMNQLTLNLHSAENSNKGKRSSTKVKKLAREYSQRIKSAEYTKEALDELHSAKEDEKDIKEPVWLQKLKEQRKTKEAEIASISCSELTTPEPALEPSESTRKGRLRGWVRSLVDKFSASKI